MFTAFIRHTGAVLHHSAETVLCFSNQVVFVVLPYQSIRARKENLPMVKNGPHVPSTIILVDSCNDSKD